MKPSLFDLQISAICQNFERKKVIPKASLVLKIHLLKCMSGVCVCEPSPEYLAHASTQFDRLLHLTKNSLLSDLHLAVFGEAPFPGLLMHLTSSAH